MINITTMRGEIPRDAERLLPRPNSVYTESCHFGREVITPIMGDVDTGKMFGFTPLTIFHYFDGFWFA